MVPQKFLVNATCTLIKEAIEGFLNQRETEMSLVKNGVKVFSRMQKTYSQHFLNDVQLCKKQDHHQNVSLVNM